MSEAPLPNQESFPPALLEEARKLFSGPITFELSAPKLNFLPPATMPEVAFAGRSNVGKSSLLNALTGRNSLARTSNTPGRTRELNLFRIGDPARFRLVDMPGYGYAEASKDMVRQWAKLVGDYLRGRPTLHRVLVLIDSRHGPKPLDLDIMEMLDTAAVSYQLVLTKGDKIKPTALAAMTEQVTQLARKRPAAHPLVLATSSAHKTGIAELRAAVVAAALPQWAETLDPKR